MDNKGRLSLDRPGSPSGFRGITRSPTHRSDSRRTSISSSSTTSLESNEIESPSSCVARNTSGHDCALHRFMVWVAVKRNESPKMRPEEKLECPLLRCRARFPSHELMLQHLYTCTYLSDGEYWCYDCGKSEHLHDDKCRRCLGHPSRRKRIMSMAKSLFSTLGHKPKTEAPCSHGGSSDEAPPSYDSVLGTGQAELQASEVHEIDSSEIALETIIETPEPDTEECDFGEIRRSVSTMSSRSCLPPGAIATLDPAELESASVRMQQSLAGPPHMATITPQSLMMPLETGDAGTPSLQVFTRGLERYRRRDKRSKILAPSSSVRSTTSTASTDSTNSTNSTKTTISTNSTNSCSISPISNWSSGWVHAKGFESTLTSPADDTTSLSDLLPFDNPLSDNCKFSDKVSEPDVYYEPSSNMVAQPDAFLSELPADMPMLDAFSKPFDLSDNLAVHQPALPLDPPMPSGISVQSNVAIEAGSEVALVVPQLSEPGDTRVATATNLVDSLRDVLHEHISASIVTLESCTDHHLAESFRQMHPSTIISIGLETLRNLAQGQQTCDPIKLLSFIHLVYSFSVVILEKDAPARWSSLFSQALTYRFGLATSQDFEAFVQVVGWLWRPGEMTQEELASLLRSQASESAISSKDLKGKAVSTGACETHEDTLLSIAQYFLDELEYQALQEISQPEIQASDLHVQHLKDLNLEAHNGSPFAYAVHEMLKSLLERYSGVPRFRQSLKNLMNQVDSTYITTPRRLELELIHEGRIHLSATSEFDEYIAQIRKHVDALYTQESGQADSRTLYHLHGIKLIQSIIDPAPIATQVELGGSGQTAQSASDGLCDFFNSMNSSLTGYGFNLSALNQGQSLHAALPVEMPTSGLMMDPAAVSHIDWLLPQDCPSTSGISPAEMEATELATQQAMPEECDDNDAALDASKTESDSCCEICGYRPKGDPRWFGGSMAKHKKMQHGTSPPKIYRCPYPGCKSQYKNRSDNLRQHQIEKGHFVEGEDDTGRRPVKRKRA